jgi:hypothetical protein
MKTSRKTSSKAGGGTAESNVKRRKPRVTASVTGEQLERLNTRANREGFRDAAQMLVYYGLHDGNLTLLDREALESLSFQLRHLSESIRRATKEMKKGGSGLETAIVKVRDLSDRLDGVVAMVRAVLNPTSKWEAR